MLTAMCHCGAVRVMGPRKPRSVTDCNCSICRRYGVLCAYYRPATVHIEAKRIRLTLKSKMGVNARNFRLDVLSSLRIRPFNGAAWHGTT